MRDPQWFTEEEQQASEPTAREERLLARIAVLERDVEAADTRARLLDAEVQRLCAQISNAPVEVIYDLAPTD